MKYASSLKITNPDKVYFPRDGITKKTVVEYYGRISPQMIRYTQDRALILQRFPEGIGGQSFYQKEASSYFPSWIRRAKLEKQGGTVEYAVGDEQDTLLYLANQGTITFHSLLSRVSRPLHPIELIIDLDPSTTHFDEVMLGAKTLRKILQSLKVESFVKTTGSKGLHVMVPIDGSATFDITRDLAVRIAAVLIEWKPELFTMEYRKLKRGDRVFVDVGRNAYSQHAVVPYSIRPFEGAPVAAPLDWKELNSSLHPQKFNIGNIFRRLGRKSDPWEEAKTAAYSVAKMLKQL